MTAARKGPKPAIGTGDQPCRYSRLGHQDSAQESTKKVING